CSYASSTNIQEPSPTTKPSRFRENGRDPRSGSWFQEGVMIFIRQKPFIMPGAKGVSTPPTSMAGSDPNWICLSAYPSASVDEVQPVVKTWLYPRKPKRMLTSLESVPIVPLGMLNKLACFTVP